MPKEIDDMDFEKKQHRTKFFFDSYAQEFSAIYGNKNNIFNRIINDVFRKSMAVRFTKTLEACTPINDKAVIDVGCGPGHYGVILAQNGARLVEGVDFADGMISLASQNAADANMSHKCSFVQADVVDYQPTETFDFSLALGLFDYIDSGFELMERMISYTSEKAIMSFPVAGGFLAWQRELRYMSRCPLYFYSKDQLEGMISRLELKDASIERIDRDYFVTLYSK